MPTAMPSVRARRWSGGRATALAVLAVAGAQILQAGEAAAQSPAGAEPRAMIVLDGSGSMWGKIGKDVKATSARDAIKQALSRSSTLQTGLTAFGHRRAGDCSDVEVAVPVGKGGDDRLGAFLEKYNPRGKGPLGAALKAASEALASQSGGDGEARRTLIVIADNADNCKFDTCALASELKQAQPRLTAHVLALGVPKDEIAQLACIAQNTGGRLFKVESGAELTAALEDGLKLAAGPQTGPMSATPAPPSSPAPSAAVARPQVAAPPPEAPPTGKPGLRLSAVLATGGPPITSGLRWRVLADDGAKAADRRLVHETEDSTPSLDLPPGAYRVEAQFGLVAVEQSVRVGATNPTVAQLPLNAGIITVKDSSARGGPAAERIFYTLYTGASAGGDKPRALALTSDAAPVYNVPAGAYLITVQQGLARIERSVSVAAGSVVDVDIPLYLGDLRLNAVATEGGTVLDRVFFQVFEDDPEAPDGLRELVRSGASRPEFSLPAGSYLVVARQDGAEARERVTVKPGAKLAKTLVLASGRLTVASRLPARASGRLEPELLSYRVERLGGPPRSDKSEKPEKGDKNGDKPPAKTEVRSADTRADGRGEEVARAYAADSSFTLTAGRYRVEGRYGPINVRAVREVEVKAGGSQAVTLEYDAGLVTLRMASRGVADTAAQTAAGADVFWEIVDAGGRQVWTTGQSAPRLALAAGRYVAKVEHQNVRAEQAFQVAPGEDRIVELEVK